MKMISFNGNIINLDNITYIEDRAFGGYLIHFTGDKPLRLENEDYNKLKKLIECDTL